MLQFGNDIIYPSKGCYTIPCSVAGKNIALEVDLVEIPELQCLLSMQSMKKARTVIDMEQETVRSSQDSGFDCVIGHIEDIIMGMSFFCSHVYVFFN